MTGRSKMNDDEAAAQRITEAASWAAAQPFALAPADLRARVGRRRRRHLIAGLSSLAGVGALAGSLTAAGVFAGGTSLAAGAAGSAGLGTTVRHGPPVSACGAPFTLRSPHGTTSIDGCAGMLSRTHEATLHLRRGQRFTLSAVREQNGRPDFKAPRAPDARVIGRLRTWHHGGSARYVAVGVGSRTLTTASVACDGGRAAGVTLHGIAVRVCPVLRVVVSR